MQIQQALCYQSTADRASIALKPGSLNRPFSAPVRLRMANVSAEIRQLTNAVTTATIC
jgi:hypothetical protein